MIVEDQFYLARDVKQTLQEAGAQIMGPFPDQEDALAALEGGAPSCAILDVNFGEGARYDLADELHRRGVPFLFFTGYDREIIPARFEGVMRLQKPVDSARLLSAAASVCDTAACSQP